MLKKIILPSKEVITPNQLIAKGRQFLPLGILKLMRSEIEDEPILYRATNISRCLCQAYLQYVHDYTVRLDDLYKSSFRGAFVHGLMELETASEPDMMIEERLSAEILGVKFSGKMDGYNKKTHILTDYKSAAGIMPMFAPNEHHLKQMEIYLFLLEKNGYPVKKIVIETITMDTWMRCFLTPKRTTVMWPDAGGAWKMMGAKAKLRPIAEIEQWAGERLLMLQKAEQTGVYPAPEISALCNYRNKKQRNYCDVRAHCPAWHPEETT